MKQAILNFFKEIGKELLIALFVTLILWIFSVVFHKTYYFKIVFTFIIHFWINFVIVLITISSIFLYYKYKTLTNKYDILDKKINQIPKSSTSPSAPVQPQILETKNKILSLESKLSEFDDELYELKREQLYRKAEKHQSLHQRGALLCRLGVIEKDIEKNNSFNLEESLEELYDYIKNEKYFSPPDLSDTKNSLNKIKNDGHKEIVEQILSMIKSKL